MPKESGIPENLTHCSECGSQFGEPVEVDVALEYFPGVELASFMCDRCQRATSTYESRAAVMHPSKENGRPFAANVLENYPE